MNLDASLNTAEGQAAGMVAPGQESLLDDFISEQEQAQEPELLLGKFKSQEDLAKAYQQLEKKLGQRQDTPAEQEPQDQSDESDAEEEEADYYEMTTEEVDEIKALAGGEKEFQALGEWARDNLPKEVVDEYNESVARGNVEAIRWAVRALMAQAQAAAADPNALVEPDLVAGKAASKGLVFESQAQVLEAMNKRNERGQRLYDVDEAYRNKVQNALAKSDVF